MTDEPNTEPGEDEEEGFERATVNDLPHVLRSIAQRNLAPAPLLMEAVTGFTMAGAIVDVRAGGKALASRRLSHFVPDMLTRLAEEEGAAGLIEVEISEARFPTRGFAFFLSPETVEDILPKAPEPTKPPDPEFPEGELGNTMRAMLPVVELMMAPVIAEMQHLRNSVAVAMEVQSEQQKKAMVIANLLADTQVARAEKMLLAEQQTPEESMAAAQKTVERVMTMAAEAEERMRKYAPPADTEADGLERLLNVLESPRLGTIGRGFLKALGAKNMAAPVDAPAVTPAAEAASQLPNLFRVPDSA